MEDFSGLVLTLGVKGEKLVWVLVIVVVPSFFFLEVELPIHNLYFLKKTNGLFKTRLKSGS